MEGKSNGGRFLFGYHLVLEFQLTDAHYAPISPVGAHYSLGVDPGTE